MFGTGTSWTLKNIFCPSLAESTDAEPTDVKGTQHVLSNTSTEGRASWTGGSPSCSAYEPMGEAHISTEEHQGEVGHL